MYKFSEQNIDHVSIKLWFENWENFVINKNFQSAKTLFDTEVVSFGTWMDVVQGLDNLVEKQWKNIWPTISHFKFLTNTLYIQLSPDKLFANSILTWTSLGYDINGNCYERPGRASITLRRDNINNLWKAIHTHLSLNRDVPQKSYGN